MNEQIKQLWVQAAETTKGDSWEEQTKFIERFAELIVLECMRMCEVTEMSFVTHNCDVEASGAITVRQFIAEHFEVGDIPAPLKPS
jgi:hypothetical protein